MRKTILLNRKNLLNLCKKAGYDLDYCKESIKEKGCYEFMRLNMKALGIKAYHPCDCGGGIVSCKHIERIELL